MSRNPSGPRLQSDENDNLDAPFGVMMIVTGRQPGVLHGGGEDDGDDDDAAAAAAAAADDDDDDDDDDSPLRCWSVAGRTGGSWW
jgi:hypothetical protein